MPEYTVYILFVLGILLLIKGADLLVEGSVSIAQKFGISHLVIGLTFVAFGTSAPELAVNIIASIGGSSGVALGNILGSNIANILLILGVASLIYPLKVKTSTTFKEIPFSMLAALVLAVLVNDAIIDGASDAGLTRSDGLILLAFFSIFVYYVYSIAKNTENDVDADFADYSMLKSIVYVLIGIAGLTIGGDWIVKGAVATARTWGITERVIGLTVVAIGTSLPELATSAIAAHKKAADIAIGNVIGSNIFNIFWVLGISASIKTLPYEEGVNIDLMLVVISSLLLLAFLMIRKKHTLEKWSGVLFLTLYLAYLGIIVLF